MYGRFKFDPLVILIIFFGVIIILLGTMALIQLTHKSNVYVSGNVLNEDEKQILEVLNKSFEAMRNKDIAAFFDCYSMDSSSFREIGAREEIIRGMVGTKKVLTYLQNIEVKFRKDNASSDLETMFGDAAISLRETTESLWWYGFIEKQIHPYRVYSFKKENGRWKIFLITDHSTGEQYISDPEIIMESVLKKFTSSDIIKILYSTVTDKGYLDLKDMQEARSRLEPLSDSLISDCRKITELDSDSAEAWYWLGVASFLKEEFEGAISSFKKAIAVSQDDTKINYKLGNRYYRAMLHCSLGQIYYRQNMTKEALNEFKSTINHNSEYSLAYAFISRIYQMEGDIENARNYRLKAFRYNPLFRMKPLYPNSRNKQAQEFFSMAGLNLFHRERFLKQAIELDEQFALAQYYLGLTYSQSGEWQKAIDCMNKVIVLDSRQEDPYWELGAIYSKIYHYQSEKRFLDLAIQNFKKAIELNPYIHELYANLAVNYFFKGDYNKAIEIMKKAKALCPYDPNVNFYMAMFLKKKLDSNIFILDKKRNYSKEIIPLVQLSLDFCTDDALRVDIEQFYNFLEKQNK